MAEQKRVRRTPEQIAADIDGQISKLEENIRGLEEKKIAACAEFDAKIAAVQEKAAKLAERKKEVLSPKKRKPRKSKAERIRELVKQAQKSGMKLDEIAEKLGISTAKVYSVATFYENFSLEAKGRHIIKVCTGTACHVRKSGPIYDSLRDALGLTGKRKTSADGLFTLETVACLGACGLAPVMTIDGEVHAKMTPEDALALVEDIRRKEAATA